VAGLKNLKNIKRGVIFVSNHTSELDPVLVPVSLPFLSSLMPMFYTCREKSFYKDERFGWKQHAYGGIFFRIWGAYEVMVGQNDYELALKKHIEIMKDGHSICIFPEGRKNVNGDKIEARGGVAFLSYRTGIPIIPVKINGAIEKKKITVTFGKPLFPKDIFPDLNKINPTKTHDDYKIAAKLIMEKIKEM